MEFYITKQLLEKLSTMADFDKLGESKLPDIFKYKNRSYVIIGSLSSQAKGFISVSAHEIIPLDAYVGEVTPEYSNKHYSLVFNGKRERGYNARLLKSGSQKFVMINPRIDFKPLPDEPQLNLF